MERKSGFYWVKFFGEDVWSVAYYSCGFNVFTITGFEGDYSDEIEMINENRIMSPDEWE